MNSIEKRIEQIAGIAAVAFLVIGCFVVVRPFISAVAWAAILCYSTWPVYSWIERKLSGKHNLAATLMTLLIATVVVLPFVVVGFSLADNVSHMIEKIRGIFHDGAPTPPSWVGNIPLVGKTIESYWLEMAHDSKKSFEAFKLFFDRSKGWLVNRGLDLGQGLFQLVLSVFVAFFFYRDGPFVIANLHRAIQRIVGDRTQHLLSVIGGTIKSVVYGILGTALAQGTCAVIGFWFAGLPLPLLWGLLTFFFSLIPSGPPFIWVPATIWLFYQGSVGWGIFLGIWGLFVISGVDNIVKPYLISRGSNLPFILVFLGVLGGVLAFGFIGLFLGPTLLAVGYSLLQEWSSEKGNHLSKCN